MHNTTNTRLLWHSCEAGATRNTQYRIARTSGNTPWYCFGQKTVKRYRKTMQNIDFEHRLTLKQAKSYQAVLPDTQPNRHKPRFANHQVSFADLGLNRWRAYMPTVVPLQPTNRWRAFMPAMVPPQPTNRWQAYMPVMMPVYQRTVGGRLCQRWCLTPRLAICRRIC